MNLSDQELQRAIDQARKTGRAEVPYHADAEALAKLRSELRGPGQRVECYPSAQGFGIAIVVVGKRRG